MKWGADQPSDFDRAAASIAKALELSPEQAARKIWLDYRNAHRTSWCEGFREELVLALAHGLAAAKQATPEARAETLVSTSIALLFVKVGRLFDRIEPSGRDGDEAFVAMLRELARGLEDLRASLDIRTGRVPA